LRRLHPLIIFVSPRLVRFSWIFDAYLVSICTKVCLLSWIHWNPWSFTQRYFFRKLTTYAPTNLETMVLYSLRLVAFLIRIAT